MPNRPKIGILIVEDKEHFFMNDIMHCMNSNARKVTSYKFVFFKAILDNLFNAYKVDDTYRLDFHFLAYSFSKIYWNLAAKHNVPQIHNGRKSIMVEQYNILKNNPNYHIDGVDFDVVCLEVRNKYLKATETQITKDVLWALYTDFNCHIYGYNEIEKYLYFSEDSYKFLSYNKEALEKIDFYAWIKWTENILEIAHNSINNLSRKLDEEPERIALDRFKRELLCKGDDYHCFYCGCDLANKNVHLDHFIPWSFIKDNQLWNFVLSCAGCNENKKDKIPNKRYFDKLIERNRRLFEKTYEANLEKSYEAALCNGFDSWEKV